MSTKIESRRPRILAKNRKLRHLKGLSLRNLSFVSQEPRSTDETAPCKKSLYFENLLETGRSPLSPPSNNVFRQSFHLDYRRSTQPPRKMSLSLTYEEPALRQRNLRSLVDCFIADVFFTLHGGLNETKPIYISEVRERSANFDFYHFDLSHETSSISRSSVVIVRVWSRRPRQHSWILLIEDLIDLRDLNYIESLTGHSLPPNALLIQLEDGLYSLDFPASFRPQKQSTSIPTSSFNSLMKLANLESSIRDAIDTRRKLAEQIDRAVNRTQSIATDAAKESTLRAENFLSLQRRACLFAKSRRNETFDLITQRRTAMERGRKWQHSEESHLIAKHEKLISFRMLLAATKQDIRGQRRRICSELSDIFPIIPKPIEAPLSFQICGLPLPNSTYDVQTSKSVSEDVLSAALGLVALLSRQLQFYLSYPLPYSVHHFGSRSSARDDISFLPKEPPERRDFSLNLPRGGSTINYWRFEYGWFLLNKNIEALCASQGLKIVDIRHTLPNLKYLLYVCSAGNEEIPARKSGGVRGLWTKPNLIAKSIATILQNEPKEAKGESFESSTSRDNMSSRAAYCPRLAACERIATAKGVTDIFHEDHLHAFIIGQQFTLRTKGLREDSDES